MTSSPAPLRLLYFAWLRERVGLAEEDVAPPPDVTTVGDLVTWLCARSPRHGAAFTAGATIRYAVNQEFAGPESPLAAGDEVAFFPPITGG
ncbi:MAG: molybdopterin converting factor subunit 1 [Thermomicrobiales bacterium]